MAQVIGHFLLGLGGDAAQRLVGRGDGNGAPEGLHEGSEIELAQHGVGEIAVVALDQQAVHVVALTAQEGEVVLAAALALEFSGISIERAGLAEQVETHIGKRQFLFEDRRMAAPFRQAVTEDQAVIGDLEDGRKMCVLGGHHMCPTSSGMS
jgi:hypothetical protein